MAVNWTAAQRQVIEARGKTLLVSAAAGSGKTAVLTALSMVLLMLIVSIATREGKVSPGAFMNYGSYFGTYVAASYIFRRRERKRIRR